jgi:hypothetical protein
MPAKRHLGGRREPAQIKLSGIAARHEEGRIGDIHFGGDILHPRLWSRSFEKTYTRGISFEGFPGESIDLENRQFHNLILRDSAELLKVQRRRKTSLD